MRCCMSVACMEAGIGYILHVLMHQNECDELKIRLLFWKFDSFGWNFFRNVRNWYQRQKWIFIFHCGEFFTLIWIIGMLNMSRSIYTCNINIIENKRTSYFQVKLKTHAPFAYCFHSGKKKRHVQNAIVMKCEFHFVQFNQVFEQYNNI